MYWVQSKDGLSKHRGQRAREQSASRIYIISSILTVLFVDPFCEAAWGMDAGEGMLLSGLDFL